METLALEDPVVFGDITLRVLVRTEVTGRTRGGGFWATGRKEPLAVRIETGRDRQIFALGPLSAEARSRLGIGVDAAP